MTDAERRTLIDRFSRLSGEDVAHLLLEMMDAGEITEQKVVGFAKRLWDAYRQQRRAALQTQRDAIDRELAELE